MDHELPVCYALRSIRFVDPVGQQSVSTESSTVPVLCQVFEVLTIYPTCTEDDLPCRYQAIPILQPITSSRSPFPISIRLILIPETIVLSIIHDLTEYSVYKTPSKDHTLGASIVPTS